MANNRLNRIWCTKTEQIMQLPQMSTAKKILAYKIFLRPLLMYGWFEGQNEQLKMMEMQVLKRIFGLSREKRLYSIYTDIDVTKYIQLQKIRWHRATGSHTSNLQSLFQGLSRLPDDPTLYFIRARDKLNSQCKYRKISTSLDSNGTSSTGLRRSRRLASKHKIKRR